MERAVPDASESAPEDTPSEWPGDVDRQAASSDTEMRRGWLGDLREFVRPRDVALAAVLVSLVGFLFLLSPRPSAAFRDYGRVAVIELGGPFHIVKNVDSWEFEHVAAHPEALITRAHRYRQNRPLYVGLGWLFALPFRAVGMESTPMFSRAVGDSLVIHPPYSDQYNRSSPQYAGFVLLNWLLLVISVLLLKALMRSQSFFEPRMVLPLVLLLVNLVTKAFFWTPHVQFFSVLLPVVSIYVFRAMQPMVPTMRLRDAAGIGLVFGVLALAYGSFAVAASGAVLCILFGNGWQALRRQAARRLLLSGALLASFFAPTLLWVGFVIQNMGYFYSHEPQRYKEFVWIFASLAKGPVGFIADLARHGSNYVGKAEEVLIVPALLLSALVLIFYRARARQAGVAADQDTRLAVIFYAVATVAFYSLMGFYDYRLSWTIVPALLVVLGLEAGLVERGLSGNRPRLFTSAVQLWAIAYVARFVMKSGPWF